MKKLTSFFAKICVFLIITGFTFLALFAIIAGFVPADLNGFVLGILLLSTLIVPIIVGGWVTQKIFKTEKESAAAQEIDTDMNELLNKEESTFTIIKEELSCWNWQIVVGSLICFWGFCVLFSSFLFAIVLIVLGIGILSIGITKYNEKQEMQELALRRKIMAAAAKAAPVAEKPSSAPAPKPAVKQKSNSESAKYKTYKVAGVTHYAKNIESLGLENEDYFKSKRELIDDDLIGERIWKYQFYPEKVELVPEPENPEDPNAIKVIVDNEHVGYIKRGSCSHVKKLLREGTIADIDCTIGGGPYKFISEEYDDEKDKEVYILEKDETSLFVHLQIYEK